jgi:hypothetical protein
MVGCVALIALSVYLVTSPNRTARASGAYGVIFFGAVFVLIFANKITVTLTPDSVIHRDAFRRRREIPRTDVQGAITYEFATDWSSEGDDPPMFALIGSGHCILLRVRRDGWDGHLARELPAALGVPVTDLGEREKSELRAIYPGL